MLDRAGPRGLTLRGLAAELGGGLGSIYWYVEGKDELLELACDELVGRSLVAAGVDDPPLEQAEVSAERLPEVPDPPMEVDLGDADPATVQAVRGVRRIALALFQQMEAHPWLAAQTQLSGADRRNGLLLWEHVGRPLGELGLPPRLQFHGSTAIMGYVLGVGSEMSAQDLRADLSRSKEEQLDAIVEGWQQPAYDGLTWIRSMGDQFRRHDDLAQFAAGLDLLLLGLVQQARAD